MYAEVWYTTTVTIPYKYTEYVETGKKVNRYYLKMLDSEMTIVGKYNGENVISKKKLKYQSNLYLSKQDKLLTSILKVKITSSI